MSNYLRLTKHPVTGKWEMANWLDNHFGHHNYGVRFPLDNDEDVWDVRSVKLPVCEEKGDPDCDCVYCAGPIPE